MEVELALGIDPELVLQEVGRNPQALDELLIQDSDDLHAARRGAVPVIQGAADRHREGPEVRAEVIRDDGAVDEGEAWIRLDGRPSRCGVRIRRVERLDFERRGGAGRNANQARVAETAWERRGRADPAGRSRQAQGPARGEW